MHPSVLKDCIKSREGNDMKELITDIVWVVLSGTLPVGLILLYLFFNPDVFEKWLSIFYKIAAKLPFIFQTAHKQYVKFDLQGRINSFTKDVSKEAPFLETTRIKVEFIDENLSKKAFLENGKLILRLKRDDASEKNFVHGAYHFVSASLVHKAKRYISPSQRESIDLYVTSKLLEKEKAGVKGMFVDEYLHPKTIDASNKINSYITKYTKIQSGKYFYPVLLRELNYLGEKVFGNRKDDQIITEVNELIDFLSRISDRLVGDEKTELRFNKEYCRFCVVIVGSSYKIQNSGFNPYVDFIRKELMPSGTETIYLIGPDKHKETIDAVAAAVADKYEKIGADEARIILQKDGGGEGITKKMNLTRYLAILRLQDTSIIRV